MLFSHLFDAKKETIKTIEIPDPEIVLAFGVVRHSIRGIETLVVSWMDHFTFKCYLGSGVIKAGSVLYDMACDERPRNFNLIIKGEDTNKKNVTIRLEQVQLLQKAVQIHKEPIFGISFSAERMKIE